MRRDELRHLEHRNLAFTTEDRLQLLIGENVAFVRWVLQVMLLNIYPQLLDHLCSRERALADDRFKLGRKVKWF